MSVTDSEEYSIFDLPIYGKIGLKVKKEGETSTFLIPDPILVEEELIDKSSTAYINFTESIKALIEPIRMIEEIKQIAGRLTSFAESIRPISEVLTLFRPISEFLTSFRPIFEVLSKAEPIINLMSFDWFKVEIESRLMNFIEEGDDKFTYKETNLKIIRKFLLDLRNLYVENYNSAIELPYIIPGPTHSIDVHWITNQYRLLINFPEDVSEEITVAGHKKRKDVIKLSTHPINAVKLLLPWLNMVIEKEIL